MDTIAPRVFMSYSHDSDAHRSWVRRLATDLRRAVAPVGGAEDAGQCG